MSGPVVTRAIAEPPGSPATPVSFEEFLAWTDEDTHAEWVDGRIILMSPVSIDHQRLLLFLYEILNWYVRARQLGEVLVAPVQMRLSTRPSGREPDLLFVATGHADRLRETYLDGPADLVIEIVSPESDERDRGEKFLEYEASGITEYWLIDALRQEAAFYQLGPDGRYHPGLIEAGGVYRSAVLPGFWLRVGWLWQRPLPPVAEITHLIEA